MIASAWIISAILWVPSVIAWPYIQGVYLTLKSNSKISEEVGIFDRAERSGAVLVLIVVRLDVSY